MLHELVSLREIEGSGGGHANVVDVEAIARRLGSLEVALVDICVVFPVVGRSGGLFQGRSGSMAPELFHGVPVCAGSFGSVARDKGPVYVAESSRLHAFSPLVSATGDD